MMVPQHVGAWKVLKIQRRNHQPKVVVSTKEA
jgi:hypothetical protein